MALLPSTPESRMVPVAGRQFAERRLIRGVGAAERSLGNAWGRLTSRQREGYGSQRNFAGGLQREANRRGVAKEEAKAQAEREQGRQDAMQDDRPAPKPTNHAQDVIDSPKMRGFIKKEVDDDMYPEGKPQVLPASEQYQDALKKGRIKVPGSKPSESAPARQPKQDIFGPEAPRRRSSAAQGTEYAWADSLRRKRTGDVLRSYGQ